MHTCFKANRRVSGGNKHTAGYVTVFCLFRCERVWLFGVAVLLLKQQLLKLNWDDVMRKISSRSVFFILNSKRVDLHDSEFNKHLDLTCTGPLCSIVKSFLKAFR